MQVVMRAASLNRVRKRSMRTSRAKHRRETECESKGVRAARAPCARTGWFQVFLSAVSLYDFPGIASDSFTTWFSKKFFKLTKFVLV